MIISDEIEADLKRAGWLITEADDKYVIIANELPRPMLKLDMVREAEYILGADLISIIDCYLIMRWRET